MQGTQCTFKKDQWNVFLWASSLTDIPGKTWWLLAFSPDCVITERSGIALDGARSSGAGVVLSEWCHTMFHCESLEGEHSSHTSFTPPASPPTGQHTNTPFAPSTTRTPSTPTCRPLPSPGPVDEMCFPKQDPTYFSWNCCLLSTGTELGGREEVAVCSAPDFSVRAGCPARLSPPGRKKNGLPILAGASSGTLLSGPAEVVLFQSLAPHQHSWFNSLNFRAIRELRNQIQLFHFS